LERIKVKFKTKVLELYNIWNMFMIFD